MSKTIIYKKDFVIPHWLDGSTGEKAKLAERLAVRMYLHGLKDRGDIHIGDKIELKEISVSARQEVANISYNAGYIPVLYGYPMKTIIEEEIPMEGDILQAMRDNNIFYRKKKNIKSKSKRKVCRCKK